MRRGFFTVVNQGTVAVREYLGRSRQLLPPGLHWNVPVLHSLRKIDLRERGVDINDIHCYTNDNVPVTVSGCLFFRVVHPMDAAYRVQDYIFALRNVGSGAVRTIIGSLEYDTIIRDRARVNMELHSRILSSCQAWGVECEKVELLKFGPQNDSVADQLERQLAAERKRREAALDTLAEIRTAEGNKQARIFKSEGELQAQKNRADGEKYAVETLTKATVDQMQSLTKAFNNDASIAAKFLIEKERLTNLKELSKSTNTKIYFLPDQKQHVDPIVQGQLLTATQHNV